MLRHTTLFIHAYGLPEMLVMEGPHEFFDDNFCRLVEDLDVLDKAKVREDLGC